MYKSLLLALLLSVCINWTVAMQILNQTSKEKRTRLVSVTLALAVPLVFGFVIFSLL